MGRRTWASIPAKFRPLEGRLNVVLSRSPTARTDYNLPQDVLTFSTLENALSGLNEGEYCSTVERVFIIGGGEIYRAALSNESLRPRCASIYLTSILSDIECDTHFPILGAEWNFAGGFASPGGALLSLPPPPPPPSGTAGGEEEEAGAKAEDEPKGIAAIGGGGLQQLAGVPVLEGPAGVRFQLLQLLPATGAATATGGVAAAAAGASTGEATAGAACAAATTGSSNAGAADEQKQQPQPQPQQPALPLTQRSPIPSSCRLDPSVHEESQYLDLVRDILATGVTRGDRTGTGTLSKFGVQMRFSLRGEVLPLLTTKRVFWRGVAEELLWFLSGDTNAQTLQDKNVHIWDGNGSREYLDSIGLTEREEGDLGPVYGFQWRHFGAAYRGMRADYSGEGVDQVRQLVEKIKSKPHDRRLVLTAWNPAAFAEMALPPCHMFAQFYVCDGELSCQMYQRSADMGLGVPFNIASYALLTRLLAQVCGLTAGEFIHVIGDAHVYLNHVEPLKVQLQRTPRPFPLLRINPEVTDIDGFTYSDFTVEGYKPHKTIKMKMSV